MMFETIRVDCDDRGVTTLTLDRAEKHNALSGAMIGELTEAYGADDFARAWLRHRGLAWAADMLPAPPSVPPARNPNPPSGQPKE